MSLAASQLSSGERTPSAGGVSPARQKVRQLEVEAARNASVEAAELRDKCRTLDAEVASLRMDAAGNRRLLRKAQRDLDERAKRLEAAHSELEAKGEQLKDQRLLKTEIQRLQRLLTRATANRDAAARRQQGSDEASDDVEASPEDNVDAAAAMAAAEKRAAVAEADAESARNDLGDSLEELARLKAEAAAADSPTIVADVPSELAMAQALELDRLKAEVARLQRLVELSASTSVSEAAPAEDRTALEAALDAERRETRALRDTNMAMHSDMLAETDRLRAIADAALRESAERGAELTELRAAAEAKSSESNFESRCVAAEQLVEAMQELERLEVTIVEERHKSTDLLNRALASEEAHARDVGMLEAMLQELIGENERLASQVFAWEHTKLDSAKDPYCGADASPPSLPDLSPGGKRGCNSPMIDEPETEALPLYSSPVSCIRHPPLCPMLQQPLQQPPPFPTVSGVQIYAPQLRTQNRQ